MEAAAAVAAAAAVVVVVGFDLCIGMFVKSTAISCSVWMVNPMTFFHFAPCVKQCWIFLESCSYFILLYEDYHNMSLNLFSRYDTLKRCSWS